MALGGLISAAWLTGLAFTAPGGPLLEGVFLLRPADQREGGVRFELDAPLAPIQARAEVVEGELRLAAGRADGRVRVRVDSLRTGLEGRDRDLRKPAWLDARRWPFIGFVFQGVELPAALGNGETHELRVPGRFILHGVEQQRAVTLRVRFDPEAATLLCEGEFEVRLAEHRISRTDSSAKALIGLRVGEVATVKLRLLARRG